MDSKLFTLHTIETFWNKIKNKFYVKSANGIPKSDLDTTVQSSLSKADSALQEHQDISGKQDKSTAVTHTANMAVGSTTKPTYIAANGAATPISHSINSDVPANAKFTDTTYNDVTQSTHGLMTAADKKKLDGMDSTKYLPKSGGVMTGNIDMQTNKKDILVGTQKANVSDGTAVAGGIIEKRANMTSTLPETRSFIGSFHNIDNDKFYNLISVRHRNGCTDGNAYGMYLYSVLTSSDSLRWNKQISANVWQGDRVLLDSANFTDYALPKDGTAKKANEATTLTDSGWITCPLAVTGNTIYPTSASTIRVRKYGKMVKLEGWVKYSTAFNTGHNVATIPAGYRPANVMYIIGATNSGAGTKIVFYAGISAGGNIGFSPADQNSSATFNPAMCYEFHATYFID